MARRIGRRNGSMKMSVRTLFLFVATLVLSDKKSFAFITTTQNSVQICNSEINTFLSSALNDKAEIPAKTGDAGKFICSFDSTDFSGRTAWPYTAADLNRLDNSDDSKFYDSPRLVKHIDDFAIESLTDFYKKTFENVARGENCKGEDATMTIDILDLCSSWISHLPVVDSNSNFRYGKVVGLGMNQEELEANPQLSESIVQDLNANPKLVSFDDESFDFVTMTVSIDYLVKPLEVMQEIQRVLKPKGSALVSFGDRCFPTKAIAMWLQADFIDRITIVASYLHYAQFDQDANMDGGDNDNDGKNEQLFQWKSIDAFDLKEEPREIPAKPSMGELISNPALGLAWMNSASAVQKVNNCDPLFVIKAVKS